MLLEWIRLKALIKKKILFFNSSNVYGKAKCIFSQDFYFVRVLNVMEGVE